MSETAPIAEPAATGPLKGRVARGAAWIFGAGLFARSLGALNTIVVARLLVPDDIGLVAVATIVMQLLQGFSDIGAAQAVVKFQDAGRDDLDTLFTLSVLRGLLIAGLLVAGAPVAAHVYGDPRMTGVFLGVAAFPLLTGLVNPRFYEFERELVFSREFLLVVLQKLTGVIVSLAVAIVFRSYWAIILGLVSGAAAQLVLSYLMRPYRPRFTLRSFAKVFGFSGWLTAVGFMAALNNKLDVPILARMVGSAAGGFYFMGLQLSEMVTGEIAAPLTRAIYPGLAGLQRDVERMRRAFLKGVAALGAAAAPAALGFAFVADDFTTLVLGDHWARTAWVIKILAPVIGGQALFYAAQSYAMALGLTKLVFYRELAYFCVRLPVFVWATASYGLEGAVWAAAGVGMLRIALNLALYARASGHAFWEPLMSARRSLGAAAAMAAYFLLLRPHLGGLEALPIVLRLGLDIAAGAGVYLAAHWALWTAEGRPEGIERDIVAAAGALAARLSRS